MEYILFFTLFTVLKAFKTESSKYILGFGHSFNNSANFTFPYCAILKRSKFNDIILLYLVVTCCVSASQ